MNNIFNLPKPEKHVGRNVFDLSASRVFSMRPSVMRPAYMIHTVPNSAYRIDCADIVRTSALQRAAFLRGKQELDWYFIPYSQILTNANNIILGEGDDYSPAMQLPDTVPTFWLTSLIQYAAFPYIAMRYLSSNGGNLNMQQDWEEFLHSWFNVSSATVTQAVGHKMLRLCVYDDLSTSQYGSRLLPRDLNWIGADVFSLLAACGYGDYYRPFKALMDYCVGEGYAGDEIRSEIDRFLKTFDPNYNTTTQLGSTGKRVNILNLVAYQKIWKDYYRDSLNDDSPLYEYASNTDLMRASAAGGTTLSDYLTTNPNSVTDIPLLTYLRPRLRMFKKDLTCGIYKDTQLGSYGTTEDISAGDEVVPVPASGQDNMSAYAMRYAFALQSYREMLLRAGSRTRDLLKAQFGVESRYVQDTYPHYLGSFDGSIELNKVSATSDSGDYSVGDLAANAFSSIQGKTIDFTSNDYGILVGVLSFVADPLINAFGVDPFCSKYKQFDFYHEDFANLGLTPVSSSIFSPFSLNSSGTVVPSPLVLGYAARDFEYKTQLDLVYDSFTTSYLAPASLPDDVLEITNAPAADSNYVAVKSQYQILSALKTRAYQYPDVMDTVFKSQDSGHPEDAHFKVALQANISAILPMPVSGMNL